MGDLWFGEGVGALLFRRDGEYTATFWTNGEAREIEFDPRTPVVTHVDIMGREQQLFSDGEPLTLYLSDDPIYIVGVSPELAEETVVIEDMSDRWPFEVETAVRTAPYAFKQPSIDGQVNPEEWKDALELNINRGKDLPGDFAATGYLFWDEDNLYLGFDIIDDDPFYNPFEGTGVFRGDSIELYVCAKPDRRIVETRGQYDYQVVISPTSKDGTSHNYFPGFGSVQSRFLEGADLEFSKTDKGWQAEMRIPLSNFPEFPAEHDGKAAFEILINDYDEDNLQFRDKYRIDDSVGTKYHRDAGPWALLMLSKEE